VKTLHEKDREKISQEARQESREEGVAENNQKIQTEISAVYRCGHRHNTG